MALSFLAETDVRFADADLVEAGFVEEDFADIDLDGADFFDPDLVEAVVGLGDSDLGVPGDSARRRWTYAATEPTVLSPGRS